MKKSDSKRLLITLKQEEYDVLKKLASLNDASTAGFFVKFIREAGIFKLSEKMVDLMIEIESKKSSFGEKFEGDDDAFLAYVFGKLTK